MLSLTALILLCLPKVFLYVLAGNLASAERERDRERTAPEIKVGPTNATTFVDRNHTFICRVSGHPKPTVIWQKKNESTGPWKEINRSNGRIRVTQGRLTVNRLLTLDTGFYRCVAENALKNTSSGIAFLNVQAKAAIVEGPRNQTVAWGSEVSLPCEAVGKPLPVRTWYKNGVAIKNETTHLSLSGPLYSFSANESAIYECRVQNAHAEGMTNTSVAAFIRVLDGKCEQYEGEVCRDALHGSGLIFSRLSEANYQVNMEELISRLTAEARNWNASEDCLARVLRVICKMAFPTCRDRSKTNMRQQLCRDSCLAVRNLFCEEWWMKLEIREHFDCQSLPQNRTTEKCEFVNFFDLGNATETTRCYQGNGEAYVGTIDVTKSGVRCQPWKSTDTHRHKLSPSVVPNLRSNHCRNPGGLRERPWCYTTNSSVEWEYCNVPVCKNLLSSNLEGPESEPIYMYMVAGILGLLLFLLAVASFVVWRQRHSRRSHNVSDARSPDDEKLMSELRQLPSVEVAPPSAAQASLFSGLEFDRNSVVHVEDIAVGAFGPVFKARLDSRHGADQSGPAEGSAEAGKRLVAVKVLGQDSQEAVRREFVRQASLLASLDHPNVVRLVGVCFVGSPLCVALEFMARGDLHSFLPSLEPLHFIHSAGYYVRQLLVAQQLVSVLGHLERLRLLHRDLAARNFLVGAEDYAGEAPLVKLADFGLAVRLEPGEDLHVGVESEAIAVRWTAPESIVQGHFTLASDVWSFGVLLWEVFSYGRKPYGRAHSLEDVSRFVLGGGQLECPCPDHPEIFDLMKRCWRFQPELRCSAGTLASSLDEIVRSVWVDR